MIKAPVLHHYEMLNVKLTKLEGESKQLFDEIFEVLGKIDTKDSERRISLWLNAPRGSVKDLGFDDDEEAMNYFDVDTVEELEPAFQRSYPQEEYWFKVNTAHNDACRFILFDNFSILIMNEGQREIGSDNERGFDCLDFLQWLHYSIQEKVKEIEQGVYGQNLEKNLPYRHRCGIISRRKYWELVPEDKEYQIGKLSNDEIEKFIKLYKVEGDTYIPDARIKNMTFNKYFQMAIYGYEAMGLPLRNGSLKDKFETYGEDFGGMILEELDMASTKDFYEFFTKGSQRGGHPWGIWRGSSRSRIMLRPALDKDGYFFFMSGDENWSCYEIVKMYLALKENGVPVKFGGVGSVVAYLQEKDFIGIVPYDSLCCYCQSMFPNKNIQDFRYFDEEVEGLFDEIEWLPLRDYTLKKES